MTKSEFKRYLQHSPVQNDGKKIAEYLKKALLKPKVNTVTSATVDYTNEEDWNK